MCWVNICKSFTPVFVRVDHPKSFPRDNRNVIYTRDVNSGDLRPNNFP